ncbi:MAG: M23 family metallopeptidase [Myxococcota bacterium]
MRWALLGLLMLGCAKKPVAKPMLPPVDTEGSAVRNRGLDELTLMLPWYGVEDWSWPLALPRTAGSPFGPRKHPVTGTYKTHKGQDLSCDKGEPIFVVADGVVKTSKRSDSAGKYIEVVHESTDRDEVITRYLHLAHRGVREGHRVKQGQRIGRCGNTGLSTSPHLHFGLVIDGVAKPPVGRLLPRK